MSGIFGSSQWMYNSGADFYNGVATQSLRFDDGSSSYLAFTPSSASSSTDRRKVTHSFWVKRALLGSQQVLYSGNRSGGGDYYSFVFNASDEIQIYLDVDTGGYGYKTSAKYRDVSAWYNVVLIIDTTQATDTDRVKLYVNGVLQSLSTVYSGGYVAQNFSTYVMDGNEDEIGRFAFNDSQYFDGYMSEVILTIGQDNTISQFGELKNGVWIPIDYAGSYGGNGFRFQFNQTGTGTASSSTIGADTSGNDNHWTSGGIVASDCDMPDSPELNWCTLNSVAKSANVTLSEGNLGFSCGATNKGSSSTFGVSSGKWYWEIRSTSSTGGSSIVGIVGNSFTNENFFAGNSDGYGYSATALKYNNATGSSYGATWTNGDIIGVALDLDAGTLTFYKNNSSQGTAYSSISGTFNPILSGQSGTNYVVNFGQDSSFAGNETAQGNTDGNGIGDFYYAPPSGFLALCTSNLPEPTISPNETTQADDYFNTVTYSGTGDSNSQSITGVGFQPDFLWIKTRSTTYYHYLFDVVRGSGTNHLYSNTSETEGTWSNNATLTSYDSDGFTVGATPAYTNGLNNGSQTFVAWNWKAGGTAVSNTDGTITSSVSANTDAGFSIVSYTGNSTAGATVGHGLGAVARMVIIKNRDQTDNWAVGHTDIGFGNHLQLNVADASTSANAVFNSTAPTSTVFSVGTNHKTNASSEDYIAYCFAEIEGYSKFGGYTGNSSSDGVFIYTGFRPAWFMVKVASGFTNNWTIYDSVTTTFNPDDTYLLANGNGAEVTANAIDFLSNGIKLRNGSQAENNSSGTYIYMAFAENPFKYANAR